MAVFRIEKTRDYTVMSNYHLRDMSLSLKAKGLLSLMLSLPENWDYTMKGLARICKDGIDSISGGIRELEAHGYLIRARVRGANGQLGSIEYTILEQPKAPSPTQEKPIRENPVQANPMLDAPIQENPAQLNKEESSNYPSKTDLSITQGSSPIPSSPPAPGERTGQDGMRKRESYRALILFRDSFCFVRPALIAAPYGLKSIFATGRLSFFVLLDISIHPTTFYCSPRFQGYALLVHCVSLNTSYYSHSVYCYYSFDRI